MHGRLDVQQQPARDHVPVGAADRAAARERRRRRDLIRGGAGAERGEVTARGDMGERGQVPSGRVRHRAEQVVQTRALPGPAEGAARVRSVSAARRRTSTAAPSRLCGGVPPAGQSGRTGSVSPRRAL